MNTEPCLSATRSVRIAVSFRIGDMKDIRELFHTEPGREALALFRSEIRFAAGCQILQ